MGKAPTGGKRARKSQQDKPAPQAAGEDSRSLRAIKRSDFDRFLVKFRSHETETASEAESFQKHVDQFVKDGGHKKAWAMAKSLLAVKNKREGGMVAVQELLFHFDIYVEMLGLRDQAQLPLDEESPRGTDPDFPEEGDDPRSRAQRQPGATESGTAH